VTGCDFVVLWDGTPFAPYGEELLPPRAERSSLPIDRDEADDRQERKIEQHPPDPSGRLCACGCLGVLREQARRKDGRLKCREWGVRFLHGHHMRGRVRS